MSAQQAAKVKWQPLAVESDASKAASLSFAVVLHLALIALMFVGFATASIPPTERAGQPIEFMLMDVPKAPTAAKKPVPAQRIPVPKPPKPQVAKPDDVTDHNKPIIASPKMPDPLAIEVQEPPDKRREQDQARQEALDKIIQEKEEAAKERLKKQQELIAMQEEMLRQATAQQIASETLPLKGNSEDNSLLAQYQSAIQSTIEARSQLSRSLRQGVVCWVRVTQLPGGEVMSVVPLPKCNASEQERAELIEGVMRAAPLPYSGFESVFNRLVDVPFEYAKE
jgi:colicin import membrane protein